jgi:peptidoglycan/LPS O-acetylase OafA/YrhL
MNQSVRYRLLAGTFALFAARLILSLIRTGPVLVADEIGYLTNARVLAGGAAGQLEQAPFYRGGYSLLIAPLVELGASPTFTYHLVLVLNAALAASVFPLLYLLLTRFGRVRPELALWAALAGAVYPALTVLSQVAMSENALFPLVVVWLIAFGGVLAAGERGNDVAWAVGLGAATGGLWAVHNRMIVAVALAVGGLAWLAWRRRLRPAALVAGLGVIALAFVGVHFLDSYLIDHNYAGSAPDELSERMDSLAQFSGLRTTLANLIGQSWYLLVATFGLAAAAAWDFLRPRSELHQLDHPADDQVVAVREDGRPAPMLGVLLALTALLLAISAAAFPERTRPDMLIYGRYAEVAAPALVAFGLAALSRVWSSRRLAVPLVGFGALTAVVVLIRVTASDPDAPNRWNISALPFVTVQLGAAVLIGAAAVAVGGALLLRRASSFGTPASLGLVAIGLFLAVVAYGAWNPVRSSQRAVYPAGWESPQAVVADSGGRTIAYDLDHYDTIGLYAVQWFLPDSEISLFEGKREAPASRLVISDGEWPQEHPAVPAKLLWSDPGRDQSLWRLGGTCPDAGC